MTPSPANSDFPYILTLSLPLIPMFFSLPIWVRPCSPLPLFTSPMFLTLSLPLIPMLSLFPLGIRSSFPLPLIPKLHFLRPYTPYSPIFIPFTIFFYRRDLMQIQETFLFFYLPRQESNLGTPALKRITFTTAPHCSLLKTLNYFPDIIAY